MTNKNNDLLNAYKTIFTIGIYSLNYKNTTLNYFVTYNFLDKYLIFENIDKKEKLPYNVNIFKVGIETLQNLAESQEKENSNYEAYLECLYKTYELDSAIEEKLESVDLHAFYEKYKDQNKKSKKFLTKQIKETNKDTDA